MKAKWTQDAGDLVTADDYVDGGKILVGKLVGTFLGSIWLAFIGGWISVQTAVAQVHIQALNQAGQSAAAVVTAFGAGGADTLRYTWGEAFRAAVETSPLLAPAIMSVELIVVSYLLIWARRRWT